MSQFRAHHTNEDQIGNEGTPPLKDATFPIALESNLPDYIALINKVDESAMLPRMRARWKAYRSLVNNYFQGLINGELSPRAILDLKTVVTLTGLEVRTARKDLSDIRKLKIHSIDIVAAETVMMEDLLKYGAANWVPESLQELSEEAVFGFESMWRRMRFAAMTPDLEFQGGAAHRFVSELLLKLYRTETEREESLRRSVHTDLSRYSK